MTLYDLLGYKPEQLQHIIDNKERYYVSYKILKSNGKVRWIDAPQFELKDIQEKILHKILYKFTASDIAHGFVKHKNPKTHAEAHVGKKTIITADIKDFFNSIYEGRVYSLLISILNRVEVFDMKNSRNDIGILSELMTFKNRVPQGAPTSPALSNLICLNMDAQLKEFAKKHDCVVTRYADDIAISFNHNKIKPIILGIFKVVGQHNFRINYRKVKVRRSHKRQKITGVVVNKTPNAPKQVWKNLRAQLHNMKKSGQTIKINSEEYQKLRGKIEWVRNLNETKGNALLKGLQLISVN